MNEKELLKELKRIEEAEKLQERIIEKKKVHVEKLSLKGNSETIEKVKAQEERAITVLERIREDKRRVGAELKKEETNLQIQNQIRDYVQSHQPTKITEIAEALNLPTETIEKHLVVLEVVKDEEDKIYSDGDSMSAIRSEEWEKKRKDVIRRWSEIGEKNPVLTLEELREVYIMHYPEDDKELERYLEEREEGAKTKDGSQHTGKIIRYEKKYNGNACVLCLLLCIGIIPGLLYYLLARETIPIYEGDDK